MEIELLHQPDSAIARVSLDTGEELYAQAGSMVAMSGDISPSTSLRQGKSGGIMGAVKRLATGESLFVSTFQAPMGGGEVFLAPKLMGDVMVYEMTGQDLLVQAGSYLASSDKIDLNIGFEGLKSLFSGESIFWIVLSGYGTAILSSFGGIYEIAVDGEYIVDTGHVVAFERSLNFEITKPPGSSWISAFLGGEGLVLRFQGQGRVFCQTHNNLGFGQLVGALLPPRSGVGRGSGGILSLIRNIIRRFF